MQVGNVVALRHMVDYVKIVAKGFHQLRGEGVSKYKMRAAVRKRAGAIEAILMTWACKIQVLVPRMLG